MRNHDRTVVTGQGGLQGYLVDPLPNDPDESVRIQLDGSQILEIPSGLLTKSANGTYSMPFSEQDIREMSEEATSRATSSAPVQETVIPVVAEELDVHKRAVATGRVRVHRRVLEHEEAIDMPLKREHVEIRRVLLERDVEGPLPVRTEGDTIVVPIVEEVLVLTRRYRLKEEVHITKRVREERYRDRVILRSQQAEIEESDSNTTNTLRKR